MTLIHPSPFSIIMMSYIILYKLLLHDSHDKSKKNNFDKLDIAIVVDNVMINLFRHVHCNEKYSLAYLELAYHKWDFMPAVAIHGLIV